MDIQDVPEGKARLYCESHITLDNGCRGDTFEEFVEFLAAWLPDWRASKFDEDLVDNYHGKWFMSARHPSYAEAVVGMRTALQMLRNLSPLKVLRYKIEDTLMDSKFGDTIIM